jgi:uncharacterized protein YukE/cell wall-associated NlpC family hydrolase
MSHKDDASALPGNAPQLATLADPVYNAVSAGAFEELANRFTEAGGKAAEATIKVKSVIGNVDGIWAGAAADSFVDYMNGFTNAGLAVGDVLTNAASDLQNSGAAMLGARNALEGVFANLVTEVRALGCQADRGEAEGEINEAVERHRPQVMEQLDAANLALTNATSALSGLPNEINPKFSAMGDPDTGTFAPNGGTPIESLPAPPESPAPNGEDNPDDGASPDSKILDAARGELGYQEGPGNANKYGPSAAWCSSFATWVWKQAGVDIPSMPFTGDVYNWGEQHGLAYGTDNLGQARPGDVLLFGTGPESPSTSTHIGVVETVDGDQVTLIEGNSSDQVQRVTHTLSGETFYGGVHPR